MKNQKKKKDNEEEEITELLAQRKTLPVEEGIQSRVYGEQKTHHGYSYQRLLRLCRKSGPWVLEVH